MGDLVEQTSMTELLAGIAERRAETAATDRAQLRRVDEFFEAASGQLEALGESLGFPYQVLPGERDLRNTASLVVERPTGKVTLLSLFVDLQREQIQVETFHNSGMGNKPKPVNLVIDQRFPEQLVTEAIGKAAPLVEQIAISWDQQDRNG